jgi:VWFA-related protein
MRLVWPAIGLVPVLWIGQAQAPVFRTHLDLVTVDVSVTRRGAPVQGLRAEDFVVTDNGVPQTVTTAAREPMPIDLTLVVDMSGSVRGPLLGSLRRAVDAVVGRLSHEDEVRVVRFDHRLAIDAMAPLAARRPPGTALGSPHGHTSIFDALSMALITEPRPNRRELTIVFSDGEDTLSIVTDATLVEVARRANGAVFVVSVTDSLTRRHANEAVLRQITELTGGRLALLRRDQAVDRSFLEAFDDFRTSYVLRYEATGVDRPGWHDLRVSVRGRSDVVVRARSGYFGG